MQPLPAAPFKISTWAYRRKVNKNVLAGWAKNFYSAPFTHIGAIVDLRVTDIMLKIYGNGERLPSPCCCRQARRTSISRTMPICPTGAASRPGIGPGSRTGRRG